ncbi:MAG: hypothetical protein BAJALOKI1v1_850003 [Promethearchaeota archaeon]|nr:MAG: hypothetical protein BAJALOKI1v1_850003 [Candidatus Lokiarchaeota archaeon]
MSESETKKIYVDIRELSYKKDQYVQDLVVFLKEKLPQLEIDRKSNELEITMPLSLSNRSIKLRIKKFLYKTDLKDDYRPISNPGDKEGYKVKLRKVFETSYINY